MTIDLLDKRDGISWACWIFIGGIFGEVCNMLHKTGGKRSKAVESISCDDNHHYVAGPDVCFALHFTL